MIHLALNTIIQELNSYLRQASAIPEDKAILSDLVDQEGSMAFSGKNKVVGMLTAIGHEHTTPYQSPPGTARPNPPVLLNLNLLFAAYFPSDYPEALRFISLTLAFFQNKQVFTHQNSPDLPSGIEKLTVELNDLDQQAQNQLWSAIGTKMMPSISVKVRMLSLPT